MALLKPAPVHVRQLTHLPDENKYVGEISSTAGLGRVYDDACDVGLTLVGASTIQPEIVFVVSEEHRDGEGDLTHWVLKPALPLGVASYEPTIVLFND